MNQRRLFVPTALLGAVLLLAGCKGFIKGLTPTPAPSPIATATPVAPTWTFGGSTGTLSVPAGQTPAALSLVAYQNISFKVQFAAATSGSGTLTVSDATNSGDVTPSTLPADTATAGFTPLIYVSFYNGGSAAIGFGQSFPTITVTDSVGFGAETTCEFDSYSNGGLGLSWSSSGQNGTISGTSVTIGPGTLPAGSSISFSPGQQIAAIACK